MPIRPAFSCTLYALACSLSLFAAGCSRDRVLAKVGDEKITEKEFQEFVTTLPEQWQVRAKTPAGKKQILEYLIRNKLIRLEAERRGIPSRPEVKKKIEDANQRIIAQELFTEMRKNLTVPEEELKKYYEEHKAQFSTPELVHLMQILVRIQGNDPKAVERAQKKAEQLAKRAKAGESFEKLARQFSDDPGTAQQGGDQGYLDLNRYDPLIARAVQGVPNGTVVGPVRTAAGWHILKVVDRKPASERSFAEVRDEVAKMYTPIYQQQANERFLEELKQRYKVHIEEKNLEEREESPPPSPQGTTQPR